jgi:hypothetical protein
VILNPRPAVATLAMEHHLGTVDYPDHFVGSVFLRNIGLDHAD